MTTPPDPRSLAAALGPDSPAVSGVIQRLGSIFEDSVSIAPVDNSYRAWATCQPLFADDSVRAFIRQTCLSLLCRLIAYRYLDPHPSDRRLWEVISGDYFLSEGLGNFLGEDFFSWPFFRLSMGIGDDAESMETARSLMYFLETLDLNRPSMPLISSLYREFEGGSDEQEVSDDEDDAWMLEVEPGLSCLVPYCGDGSRMAQAVRTAVETQLAEGNIPPEVLLNISGQFLGMTGDPIRATVAGFAFVLALGDELLEPHPPILVPVYLANAGVVPTETLDGNGNRNYVIEAAGGVELPERVAADPLYLDWLFGRLPNYQRGAALRLRAQDEEVALQEVLNAWYNYLTSPKARTPIPDPLTPAEADVMVEAARALILGYVRGSGPGPLHLVRNAPAPLFAARREFDITL